LRHDHILLKKSYVVAGIIIALVWGGVTIGGSLKAAKAAINDKAVRDAKADLNAARDQAQADAEMINAVRVRILENPEDFRGPQGDQGVQGEQGPPGNVPVGTILAWHKNPAAKPDGTGPGRSLELNKPGSEVLWMECSGQELPSDSPLRAVGASQTPILNSAEGHDGGRFLRGSEMSGFKQEDSTRMPDSPFRASPPNIISTPSTAVCTSEVRPGGSPPSHTIGSCPHSTEMMPTVEGQHRHAISGGDKETRPVNMSVVWIIRVK
jgi:hypothetical protein